MLKKIIVILSLFLLLINIFIVSSYANFDFEYNDNSYSIPDLPVDGNEHYVFFCDGSYCSYITSSEVMTCKLYSSLSSGKQQYYLKVTNGNMYFLDLSEGKWEKRFTNHNGYNGYFLNYVEFYIASSESISDEEGNVIFKSTAQPKFNVPSFLNSQEELESGKFDYLKITSGDFNTSDNQDFYLFSYYYSNDIDDVDSIYPRKEILLNGPSNKYYVGWASDGTYRYNIPFGELGIDLKEGNKYGFKLATKDSSGKVTKYFQSITFSIGELTDAEKLQNQQDITNGKLDEQTEAIKNQTETNKNIFEKIGEMLSYINPFSENFFVYKLIELLGDMIKSLFVPSEEFMSKWFTEVSDYFSDAFGILYYPIDLVIQVLGRFSNIAEQEPIISFGSLSLFGYVIIQPYSFNFNSLLMNNILETLHNFYLIVIDVILWLGLLVYCKNVIANIFGGKFTDDVIDTVQDQDYARYSQYQANKKRYTQEHGGK